ncbi:ThiF family adenylyltransferase [Paenibacillus sp. 1P07SE]|uniref:ThiF family adenylyltransferase n=1 Tax=Paenibacillus sp. 1P07SE TaxID=3132209 RepID=UPI0039A57BF8
MKDAHDRFSRQQLFAPIGEGGQRKLAEAGVLIVGMGALGTVLANHMVRAGVGSVRIVDRDFVEWSNLQRQMLYDEDDAREALPKAIAAKRKLESIYSACRIDAHVSDVTRDNIGQLLEGMDLVLDGTDNFQTRYLLNDACYEQGIPFVYGGAVSSRGMSAAFIPGDTCCLRCLLPESAGEGDGQTCDMIGVISPIIDVVASFQAVEALKILVGDRERVRRSLLSWEMWNYHTYEMKLPAARSDCPTCGRREFPALQADSSELALMCGRDTVQIQGRHPLDLELWKLKLQEVGEVSSNPYLLRLQLAEGERLVLFPDGRVLVQGTEDPVRAKTLYARYIGM